MAREDFIKHIILYRSPMTMLPPALILTLTIFGYTISGVSDTCSSAIKRQRNQYSAFVTSEGDRFLKCNYYIPPEQHCKWKSRMVGSMKPYDERKRGIRLKLDSVSSSKLPTGVGNGHNFYAIQRRRASLMQIGEGTKDSKAGKDTMDLHIRPSSIFFHNPWHWYTTENRAVSDSFNNQLGRT